jgi:hypothetical protein
MKSLMIGLIALTSITAFAKIETFTYDCHQARTTVEEASARTALKFLVLTTQDNEIILSNKLIQILNIDKRLIDGGAPLSHVTYGGYFTSTQNEVFRCERPI